jgi:hypothetical protein
MHTLPYLSSCTSRFPSPFPPSLPFPSPISLSKII